MRKSWHVAADAGVGLWVAGKKTSRVSKHTHCCICRFVSSHLSTNVRSSPICPDVSTVSSYYSWKSDLIQDRVKMRDVASQYVGCNRNAHLIIQHKSVNHKCPDVFEVTSSEQIIFVL